MLGFEPAAPPYTLCNANVPLCLLDSEREKALSDCADSTGVALVDIFVDSNGKVASITAAGA